MPKFNLSIELAKADAKSKTVYGWAAVVTRDDGTPVIDADDHLIPIDVLKRGVQDAFAENPGSGKGGIVAAIHKELGIPPRFIGTGEEPDAFDAFSYDPFDPVGSSKHPCRSANEEKSKISKEASLKALNQSKFPR